MNGNSNCINQNFRYYKKIGKSGCYAASNAPICKVKDKRFDPRKIMKQKQAHWILNSFTNKWNCDLISKDETEEISSKMTWLLNEALEEKESRVYYQYKCQELKNKNKILKQQNYSAAQIAKYANETNHANIQKFNEYVAEKKEKEKQKQSRRQKEYQELIDAQRAIKFENLKLIEAERALKFENQKLRQEIKSLKAIPQTIPRLIITIKNILVLHIQIEKYFFLSDRAGCAMERNKMNVLFSDHFNYHVLPYEKKFVSHAELCDVAVATKRILSTKNYEGLIVIIGAHGDEYQILTSESNEIPINKIHSLFSNDVVGTQQMFFIQTSSILKQCLYVPETVYNVPAPTSLNVYHDDDDIVILRSSTEAYEDCRDEENGSWFFTAMYDAFLHLKTKHQQFALNDAIMFMKQILKQIGQARQSQQTMVMVRNTLTKNIHLSANELVL